MYLNKKTLTLGLSKTKSHRIKWTTAWRRKNKKIKLTGAKKKRRRKGTKIQKAIVGLTLAELQKRQSQNKGTGRGKGRDKETIKDIKARKRKQQKKKYGKQGAKKQFAKKVKSGTGR